MSKGYVEELALRYYQKKGYLVTQNIPFQLKKSETGKKVSGWTDIDLLAINQKEMLIIQCKSFLGTTKAEESSKALINWFEITKKFLSKDDQWKAWVDKRIVKRVLVIDCRTPKTEKLLQDEGVDIVRYSEIVKELFRELADETKYVKEDDIILRFMSALVYSGIVQPEQFLK